MKTDEVCFGMLVKSVEIVDEAAVWHIICEAFVKDELENLIQALENPDHEVKDARCACRKAKICKDDGSLKC
uniref:Uncharacterized protein n=1 Tax=Panagrolaimus sp. JU765 TaxID=591449 RepID=A0AC34RN06_9BILA